MGGTVKGRNAPADEIRPGDHVCCLYESDHDRLEQIPPLLVRGLARNEKIIYVVDDVSAEPSVAFLRGAAVYSPEDLARHRIEIHLARDVFFADGAFVPDAVIGRLRAEEERTAAEGFTALGVMVEMNWALGPPIDGKRLVEYAEKLNACLADARMSFVCQFDRRRFAPHLLLDIMASHPLVALGPRICCNHFHMPVDEWTARDRPERTLRRWLRSIRAREEALEALRVSEANWRAVFDASSDAIFIHDPETGAILDINRKVTEMYGLTPEEARRLDVQEVTAPPFTQAEAMDRIRKASEGLPQSFEWRAKCSDGRSLWVAVDMKRTAISGRKLILAFIRDITDRKQSEETLRRAEERIRHSEKMEAVGRLAGGIAHDFNNHLTAVLGYADLLASRLSRQDPAMLEAEQIRKSGERAASLVRQLLAFSRRQTLQPKVIDLNAVVMDLEPMLRRTLGENVDLATALTARRGSVKADQGQIAQVVVNLAVNARDAMPRGGRLTIETGNVDVDETFARDHSEVPPGRYIQLVVTDTGEGMDRETLAHAFEPFFTTKEPGKGTGLGLSTVYGIVKQSGGFIWADSEAGRGSSFKIFLPEVDEPPEKDDPTPPPSDTARGTETVLMVEDEEPVRTLVTDILARSGYAVLAAKDGNEGLNLAARHAGPIHLAVTDVVMPGINGPDMAVRLLAGRPGMKVLYISGYPQHAISAEVMSRAGSAYLEKPFTPRDLLEQVRRLLDVPVRSRDG